MPRFIYGYIRAIDAMNRFIGRIAMYMVFALIGTLLWSTASKAFFRPAIWTLETAQFLMVFYFVVGGPYSIQLGSNVRMDLLYAEWSPKTKAWVDAFTVFFLLYYLGVLLYGGLLSLSYSLGYFGPEPFSFLLEFVWAFLTGGPSAAGEQIGYMERSSTLWRPVLWPIKLVTCVGIFLMLLQILSELFKDIARIRGEDI